MKKILVLVSLFTLAATYTLFSTAAQKPERYGLGIRPTETEAVMQRVEKQLIRTCEIANVKRDFSQDTALEISTGMPVFIVNSYQEAKRVQELLLLEGYKTDIIEIVWCEEGVENPTVISWEKGIEMMKVVEKLLLTLQSA